MNTSEVLCRAADLIEERGWTQGPDGWYADVAQRGICLEGAMAAALGVDVRVDEVAFTTCPAYAAVVAHLGIAERRRPDGALFTMDRLYYWNDGPQRTAAEVIEVLRAAAVIEAARESEAAQVSA